MRRNFHVTKLSLLILVSTLIAPSLSTPGSDYLVSHGNSTTPKRNQNSDKQVLGARDGPVTMVTMTKALSVIPLPAVTQRAEPAAEFKIAYQKDNLDLKVCVPSSNPNMCIVSYHTNDRWFIEGVISNYGVLLAFDSNCHEKSSGNWWVLREDLKNGIDLDVGLPSKGNMKAILDVEDFTWSYGGKAYTLNKGVYGGSPAYQNSAMHWRVEGTQSMSTYDVWQIPFDC